MGADNHRASHSPKRGGPAAYGAPSRPPRHRASDGVTGSTRACPARMLVLSAGLRSADSWGTADAAALSPAVPHKEGGSAASLIRHLIVILGSFALTVMAGLRPGHPCLGGIDKARRGCPRQARALRVIVRGRRSI